MQKDLQIETMRIYKTLIDAREDWGGKLVLCLGPNCAQSGVPSAVSIAGGTTLAIDSDASAMKSAMRAGYLDFVVNTLDEALRTLKNEIRQKRPLSVGLIVDVDSALTETVERGLQPDLHFAPSGCPDLSYPQLETLRARGMSCRSAPDIKNQQACFFPAPTAAELREIDASLLSALPVTDTVRRRWIERVPKYLREARSGGRWIWLSDKELASLAEAGLSPVPQP
jgi:Urocanase Rossmann-like domain